MVTFFAPPAWTIAILLAAEEIEPPLPQLDPQRRASVILALAGLVILGLGMIALVWLGAQHVRRLARQRPIPRSREPSSWSALPRLNNDTPNLDDEAD
jgi:hypothetical protein